MLRNPIIPGFNPDPSIVRVGEDYFLATSTFEYFPGCPIYHSRDLVNWKLIGHALNRRSQHFLRSCQPAMGMFAPTLRHHHGRFYMTTCAVHDRGSPPDGFVLPLGFYVWTDDILGNEWSDPVYYDVLGIDQDLYFEDDKVYMSLAKPYTGPDLSKRDIMLSCYTYQIDLATGRALGEGNCTRFTRLSGVGEGPHIFKRGAYHYLLSAEGGTEQHHQEWISRSTSGPMGPYEVGPEDVNPLVYNGDHAEVRQTGHMDMVEGADGRWWAVFLAVRPVEHGGDGQLSQLGRETFLAPVEWVNDWPVVNGGAKITLQIECDLPAIVSKAEETFDFAPGKDLFLDGWYRLRTPVLVDYSLAERPGSLALRGSPYRLHNQEAVTMFLQKQTAFKGVWRVTLDYDPQDEHEAGTAMWFSKYAYASVGVRGTPTGRELVFREPETKVEGDESNAPKQAFPTEAVKFKETTITCPEGPLEFRVEASHTQYIFFARRKGEWEQVGAIGAKMFHRNRPFDSVMTGTHMTLYATGANQEGSQRWAFFSGASWEAGQ